MTTLDVRSTSSDDGIISNSAPTWANARDGVTFKTVPGADVAQVGAALAGGLYQSGEMMISFDTSSIPSGATITAVTLTIDVSTEQIDSVSQTLEARVFDWGASVTTADFRTGAELNALTRVATCAIGTAPSGTLTFTADGSNFNNNINKGGTTRLVICSNRAVGSGTAPANSEILNLKNGKQATSTNRPRLQVTYTTATTVTSDVTTSAAINAAIDKDVTSTAAIARTIASDVTSSASLTAPVTTEVASTAAIEMLVASDVTTSASVSRSLSGDVTTTAAVATTGAADVASTASCQVSGTFDDVFSTASIGQTGRVTVISDASIGVVASADLPTTAAIGAGEYLPDFDAGQLQPGVGRFGVSVHSGIGRIESVNHGLGR